MLDMMLGKHTELKCQYIFGDGWRGLAMNTNSERWKCIVSGVAPPAVQQFHNLIADR